VKVTGTTDTDAVHPAVHGARKPRQKITPLFPREPRRDDPGSEKEARERAMAAHPAGKGPAAGVPDCGGDYTVKDGDSLWSIASDALDSRSSALIARYWPVVYTANADLIGDEPDVIVAGQALRLPECDR
jgi:nucleoid-associated protein YgaU